MKTRLLTPLLAALLLISAPPALRAAELDPAHLPADAKWVLHVDFEALSNTALAKQVRENRPQLTEGIRKWFQDQYGIDPRQDLKGATMFSETYEAHTGTLILLADYDREKVKSDLESKPGVKASQWQDHTLYTLTIDKKKRHGKSDRAAATGGGQGDAPTVTFVLLDDGMVVAASSEQRAQQAAKLLSDDGASLKGKSSVLTEKAPDGAFVYGAAVELQQIEQHSGVFPVLRQHKQIVWAIGHRDDQVYEQATLEAASPEVAEEMAKVMEGLIAFQKVWAGDSKPLRQLADSAKVTRDGSTVHVEGSGDKQTVLQGLQEVAERIQQRRQAMRR